MTKEEIKILLDDLYLSANEEEINFINEEFLRLFDNLKYYDAIDTEGVIESSWPFKVVNTYLREDIQDHTLEINDALKNASNVQDDFVKYVKVV